MKDIFTSFGRRKSATFAMRDLLALRANHIRIWMLPAGLPIGLAVAAFLAMSLIGLPASLGASGRSGDIETAKFSSCFGAERGNCVVDGDTIWYQGQKIRIADINTPELGHAQCDYERQLGARAKNRLIALMNEGAFTLARIDRNKDRYGRALRVVTRGGESIGDILVSEGLAEAWRGYRGNWC